MLLKVLYYHPFIELKDEFYRTLLNRYRCFCCQSRYTKGAGLKKSLLFAAKYRNLSAEVMYNDERLQFAITVYMKQPCKNHPDRLAGRKCFRCKEFICSDCAQLSFHHYFCNFWCKLLFVLSTVIIKSFINKIIPEKAWKPSVSRTRALRIMYAVLAAAMIISIIILYYQLVQVSRQVTLLQETLLSPNVQAPKVKKPEEGKLPIVLPVIDSLPSNTVYKNTVDVTGRGGKNMVLVLSVNGELTDAQILTGGTFSFNNIPVKPGTNTLLFTTLTPQQEVIIIGGIPVLYRNIPFETLSKSTQRGNTAVPKIALTFDGGSNSNNAEQILTILKEKGVTATFFLTGTFIKKYPDIVRRIAADGHIIGNHTYSHPHLTTFEQNKQHDTRPEITKTVLQKELVKADSLLYEVAGITMQSYWRSPYGEHNREIREWAAELGYRHISWTSGNVPGENMDTRDWVSDESSELYKSAQEMRDAVLNFGSNDPSGRNANGAIILMHIGSERKEDFLYQVLPEIIEGLRQRGYTLCSIPELLKLSEQIKQ